ncbi:MAG: helicase-associated domain-containing protein [Ardenticatenaceae bacterium]|nr:helicase-associated domain-containing protein [Anaerolineales bacterium]MCB8920710.1 helicase-associated domain-containing protein [Ardenticatenaceae bacterium]MCB8989669.1 helicase-associated domain-containing protein [Ardenticatenaceae bacterium]MCB9002872.1 helicase-associated domain-containing protein [Ardenticatenaceae bacterium]
MRTLEQSLIDHDLIALRVIGEWWEQDLTGMDKVACVKLLAEGLATLDMSLEIQYLSPEETAAMQDLIAAGGRIPVSTFARAYGEVRQMGPGWLEREEPWFDPANVAESLWYRGFLYRGFDDTAEGTIEFYYLPTEMMAQFGSTAVSAATPLDHDTLSPTTPPIEYSTAVLDSVDDLTTILAIAQRYGLDANPLPQLSSHLINNNPDRLSLLLTLAYELNFLRKGEAGSKVANTAVTKTAVAWLQQTRESQLRTLVEAWSSSNWNDLCHTPELACEGEGWQNDPILARTALLDALPRNDNWYAIGDLVAFIKESDPDFQRPDGNYDTWYIRDRIADAYVSGFAHWDLVEGRLLRFLLRGPLSWLGLVELAADDGGLFRLTERALAWLHTQPAAGHDVSVPIVVQADASVLVPYNADRYQRFQVARISDAAPYQPGKPYLYHLTPNSLAQAQEQGISAERVLQFLQKVSARPLPPSTKRAIERWAERGVEGVLETAVILRVRDAAILDTLSQNPKTRDYLGQRLGDLAVTVRREHWQAFREATAQLGLLLNNEQ